PITFGLKAAGWLVAVLEARDGAARVREERLAVQLGGASGTLASLGDRGLDVLRGLAAELGLAEPALPWHTARGRVVARAGALGRWSSSAGWTRGGWAPTWTRWAASCCRRPWRWRWPGAGWAGRPPISGSRSRPAGRWTAGGRSATSCWPTRRWRAAWGRT